MTEECFERPWAYLRRKRCKAVSIGALNCGDPDSKLRGVKHNFFSFCFISDAGEGSTSSAFSYLNYCATVVNELFYGEALSPQKKICENLYGCTGSGAAVRDPGL